ncbi:MAG TPA: hypothetical protein V6D48_26280, partial [Oculatellaceae cyanobacterium]
MTHAGAEMYIIVSLSKSNLENQIHQAFQLPALLITFNPYQGLKQQISGIHRSRTLLITFNPYQGLKLNYLAIP